MRWRCVSAFWSFCVLGGSFCFAPSAPAHGIVGKRLFIEPLVTEDANPKNELDLPVWEVIQTPDGHTIAFNYSVEKKLMPRFSVSFDNSIVSFTPNGQNSIVGLGNIGFGAKYAVYRNATHEFILSSAFRLEAPTGNPHVGADSSTTLTPELLYAKGFGDLPPSPVLKWLRPLALQGDFALDLPIKGDSKLAPGKVPHADIVVEYSLPYVNAFVRHAGAGFALEDGAIRKGRSLQAVTGNLFPFTEFNFLWGQGSAGSGLRPQGFIRPGLAYVGHYFEIGAAAEFPTNSFTGRSVGAIGIFDLFIDDVFPKLRWPIHK
ncbi:MAG TPA: hypothetical protein VGR97_12325 [Candidatus Acidoferrales bacterium]|nr:hypothetical protein [Candidatus Acidoferrales bacterium]